MAFETKIKYDMEVWHWEECDMAYAAACFWYAAPGNSCNLPADPEGIRQGLADLRRFESFD